MRADVNRLRFSGWLAGWMVNRAPVLAMLSAAGLACPVAAQTVSERFAPLAFDSGLVIAPDGSAEDLPVLVYQAFVTLPPEEIAGAAQGSSVVRLNLAGTVLAGEPMLESGVMLRITSVASGYWQEFDAHSLATWSHTSAKFDGPTLLVELMARPGVAPSHLRISGMFVEEPLITAQDLCGVDDRLPTIDTRIARTSNGCTAWMINDTNGMLLSAAHCTPATQPLVSFSVPLSTASGGYNASNPNDQYAIIAASGQAGASAIGNDWAYFGVAVNANHGLTPLQRYGQVFTLANPPVPAGQTIRITGFGTTASPISPTWNGALKTHTGPLASVVGQAVRYYVDTTGGNSGSPIIVEATGQAIGIHTNAGCGGQGNIGTARSAPALLAALAAPRGICATGKGVVGGNLYAIGDAANNFGTLAAAPVGFAKVAAVGSRWQSMVYDSAANQFMAINRSNQIFTVSQTGVSVQIAGVVGTTLSLTGLSINPFTGQLYAMAPTTGQLFTLSIAGGIASAAAVGTASGGDVRAMEYSAKRGTLVAVANAGSGAALISIDAMTGQRTSIGPLGAGVFTLADIAIDQHTGSIWSVDASTAQVLRINSQTGAATLQGSSSATWSAALGVAHISIPPCLADLFSGGGALEPDGSVDGEDFSGFLNAFGAGEFAADIVGGDGNRPADGSVDGNDFSAFLNAFAAGC